MKKTLKAISNYNFETIINKNISLFDIIGRGFEIRTINNITYFSNSFVGAKNE
ncbi:MAG: hypothetical protein ACTHLL_08130 [Candidatus Nitrosocosmicus sp.]